MLQLLDKPPPRWVRRLVLAPTVFVLALIVALLSPVLFALAAVLDAIVDRGRWRTTRLVGVATAFGVAETFGLFALLTVWVGSGFGLLMDRQFWVKANNVLAGQYMAMVTNALGFFVGYDFVFNMDSEVRPQLLFTRHAGPGDVLRLMKVLYRDHGRRCHAIGAVKLQWDPFLDIAGERLGFRFMMQSPANPATELEKIRQLAESLGDDETMILCPEGANFTPQRRHARIEAELARGRHDRAELARSLKHTLLPKTGGVIAALEGAPDAAVTFVGHAGLDGVHGLATLWELMPLGRTVVAQAWTVDPEMVPDERVEQVEWLFRCWQQLDDWIDRVLTTKSPAAIREPQL